MERNLWSVLANEKSKYKEHYCIQNRTLSSSNVPGFIAFTYSFQILENWICYTKNRKSNYSYKKIGIKPKKEDNLLWASPKNVFTVDDVKISLPRLLQPVLLKINSSWWCVAKNPWNFAYEKMPNVVKTLPLTLCLINNLWIWLDNSISDYSEKFHLILIRKSLICAKFQAFWLSQTFGG